MCVPCSLADGVLVQGDWKSIGLCRDGTQGQIPAFCQVSACLLSLPSLPSLPCMT